ncbi:MAG: nucleoside triphosphate pyrophosphohydrolase [Flavobacteriales bacterium]|jgi:XTP/dITP diphosphohydrolase|nr:MAG: nucleoside triphosphate pyrophosphohydrolase [Flavobacteriales bacterium]
MNSREDILKAFDRLLSIMDTLRAECPWDKKQSMESLRHLTIEETYELADAILENDLPEIKKELGDLSLHMVFYAKIASESQVFDMGDVLNSVCDKLIERHPHIYGDVKAESEAEVKANWEKIKLGNKQNRSVLDGVPKSLPAVVKAFRMQEKAKGVGFDWEKADLAWEKVREEMAEFEEEQVNGNSNSREDEFGDLMFSLINYARLAGINPENALERTNKKFISRFQSMEKQAAENGKNLYDLNLEEMENLWQNAKS